MLNTLTTKGIKVSVETFYQPFQSRPMAHQYVFSYQITIENNSTEIVQLLSRHWSIIDATGTLREVKGEGVIGKKPTLRPGETHSYNSWCPMTTDTGKMFGTFLMENKMTGKRFNVGVPEFLFIASFKNN